MTQADWSQGDAHVLGVFLNGEELTSRTREGEEVVDDSFVVLFNASGAAARFLLPPTRFGRRWVNELSTAEPALLPNGNELPARAPVTVDAHALRVLRRVSL